MWFRSLLKVFRGRRRGGWGSVRWWDMGGQRIRCRRKMTVKTEYSKKRRRMQIQETQSRKQTQMVMEMEIQTQILKEMSMQRRRRQMKQKWKMMKLRLRLKPKQREKEKRAPIPPQIWILILYLILLKMLDPNPHQERFIVDCVRLFLLIILGRESLLWVGEDLYAYLRQPCVLQILKWIFLLLLLDHSREDLMVRF
jgi:hypothetical protein